MKDTEKNKINQSEIIRQISKESGYSEFQIKKILGLAESIIAERLMTVNENSPQIIIKPFTWLSLVGRYKEKKSQSISYLPNCKGSIIDKPELDFRATIAKSFKDAIRDRSFQGKELTEKQFQERKNKLTVIPQKEIQCIDCDKWFYVSPFNSKVLKTCRCPDCQKKYRKNKYFKNYYHDNKNKNSNLVEVT